MVNLKKTYVWYQVDNDGSLITPPPQGPFYSQDHLTDTFGFETEDEAVNRLREWCEQYNIHDEFVLVPKYVREYN